VFLLETKLVLNVALMLFLVYLTTTCVVDLSSSYSACRNTGCVRDIEWTAH